MNLCNVLSGSVLALALLPGLAAAEVEEGRARHTPWSGYWWPHHQGWMVSGPLTKYDLLTGKKTAPWESQHHPRGGAAKWHGYCHGWAASAVLEREPTRPRTVAGPGGQGLTLSVGDQKGLLAAAHTRDVANFHGQRYQGKPGDDFQDIYPDALWRCLKLYVKQQGLPLIIDVDPTPAVWNYPVYAYRVEYQRQGETDQYRGQMSLWLADDGVRINHVGTKVMHRTYQFTFRMRRGNVVAGSAQWVGRSVKDHPDFAWYPYVQRSENPELDYGQLRKMLGLGPSLASENPLADAINPMRLPVPTGAGRVNESGR
jgi:hypothetical protein